MYICDACAYVGACMGACVFDLCVCVCFVCVCVCVCVCVFDLTCLIVTSDYRWQIDGASAWVDVQAITVVCIVRVTLWLCLYVWPLGLKFVVCVRA